MFDTNFNRLKEFLSQEGDGNKSDLSFMGVLRETFKKYSEHYRYCKKAIIDWNCDERLFSVVIDSMCVKKIQIAGRVTNLAVLDTLRGHITAEFPDISYFKLDRSLQSSVKQTLGYVTLIFSDNPEQELILKQLKSRGDIKKELCLPDVDHDLLEIGRASCRERV